MTTNQPAERLRRALRLAGMQDYLSVLDDALTAARPKPDPLMYPPEEIRAEGRERERQARQVGLSRTIRIDKDVYDHILNNRRVGESIQVAAGRLVHEAMARQ